jgi:hypothetical protein
MHQLDVFISVNLSFKIGATSIFIIAFDEDVVVVKLHVPLYTKHPLVAVDTLFHISSRLMLFLYVLLAVGFAFEVGVTSQLIALDHAIKVVVFQVQPQTSVAWEQLFTVDALSYIFVHRMLFLQMLQTVFFTFQVLSALTKGASDNDVSMSLFHVRPEINAA